MYVLTSIIACALILMPWLTCNAYQYELNKSNGHRVHIVTLDPAEYKADIAKAPKRETVKAIAEKSKAEIAINAGFFEIGKIADGMPSSTLVIDGKIYGMGFKEHSVLKIDADGLISIETIKPKIGLRIGDRVININKVNRLPNKDEPILYTKDYSSKSAIKQRKDLVFDQSGILLPGQNTMPKDGYMVSLPAAFKLGKSPARLYFTGFPQSSSLVWGTPKLLENGEIHSSVRAGNSDFYKLPHARTAIGIKPDGSIVLVVAENFYKKANQTKATTTGLTILELATLMKSLGCVEAINLDGGGSSTLWIKGKVINKTIGDEDEGMGITMLRPVSNAVVFRKR